MLAGLTGAFAAVLLVAPPQVELAGDQTVRVTAGEVRVGERTVTVAAAELAVAPTVVVAVRDEMLARLPLYNEKQAGWIRGAKLRGVTTQETTARFLLDPDSLRVKAGPGDAKVYQRGVDYQADLEWGTFGRLPGGGMADGAKVYVDYRHGLNRIDTVLIDGQGRAVVRAGQPHNAVPQPPAVAAGEVPLANLWVPGRLPRLTRDNILPILETAFPEAPVPSPTPAERLLPKSLAKLRNGERLRLLAWGDSVTDGGFVGDLSKRWQDQFVARLKERFPKADIELIHLGWGGRNTDSFLKEPPGSRWNYQEKVLGSKPDLVVSEFVNDSWRNPAQVEEQYSRFLKDFQAIGAEWIILTPHYVRADWMGLKSERDCDTDPRPYTTGVRQFCAKHNVPCGDAAVRWGRLWRQGIPYSTLLLNAINHPDWRGMKLFADALMVLFPAQ